MQHQQKVLLNFLVIVFLLFYGTISVTTADDLTITHAYSLYSGSESVDFGPNGNYIATGDIDGDVGFWEVGDDEAIDYVNLGDDVQGVAFSPDGRYLAADGIDENGTGVWLLDVATRTTVGRRYVHDDANRIHSVAYSLDGRYVAVGGNLQWAFIWDLNSDEMFGWGKVDASEVYDVTFSPDGRYLATGNDNGDLTLWELNSWWTDNVNEIDLKPGGNVRSVAFSPDGNYLAADGYDGSNAYVNIYNVSNGSVAWQISSGNVLAIAFSPNGEYIALGDTDETITFYKIGAHPTHVGQITASGMVFDLAWSPDGTMISDGKDVWNVTYQDSDSPDNNGIGVALPPDLISEVAFAPNSTYFIVKAKYPVLTGISERNILYGSCIITLHIPDGMQGFVFPIKTGQDASVDFLLSVGINLIPLGGTFLDALDLFSKIDDSQNRVLKIELHTDARHREPPDTEMECIVLLKHPVGGEPDGIDITIEQQYRDRDRGSTRIFKVSESERWNFDDGWAAPTAQVTIFDYPAFQLLPAEVQQYLLLQFSGFGTTESGLIPKETALLANYPNPFNPETWIPYQLATPTDVSITIYAADGKLVRRLELGHQPVGIYESRSRAAYWDGRNALGEPVASGVYFYTLTAGEFTATRKMLIRK